MDETNQELQGSERQKTQTYQDTYFWLLASAIQLFPQLFLCRCGLLELLLFNILLVIS